MISQYIISVHCSICKEEQFATSSGMVCKNGHGGVEGVNKFHRLFGFWFERESSFYSIANVDEYFDQDEKEQLLTPLYS